MTETKSPAVENNHTPEYAEGLIEFLQATAPTWATKLTWERLGLIRQITAERRLVEGLVAALESFVSTCNRQTATGTRLTMDRLGFTEDWRIAQSALTKAKGEDR